MEKLKNNMRELGERLPKKHGDWYKLQLWDDNCLIYDTWNGQIYHYPNGATPSDTNNMYRCIYVFYDKDGKTSNYKRVHKHMENFWNAHITACVGN